MAFIDSGEGAEGQGPPPGPELGPGGPQSPPPMQGGPILAALARRSQSPAVSAPGPGDMAQGLMMLKQAVDMIHSALPSLEAGSQPHKDAVNALSRLTRHLPQGAPTAGVQQTQLGDMMRQTARNALLQKLMLAQQQGGSKGAGGGEGGQGGGTGPNPSGTPTSTPNPSTPIPGA